MRTTTTEVSISIVQSIKHPIVESLADCEEILGFDHVLRLCQKEIIRQAKGSARMRFLEQE